MTKFKATLNCAITYTDFFGVRRYIPSGEEVNVQHIPKGQAISDISGKFSLTDEDVYFLVYKDVAMDVYPEEFTHLSTI